MIKWSLAFLAAWVLTSSFVTPSTWSSERFRRGGGSPPPCASDSDYTVSDGLKLKFIDTEQNWTASDAICANDGAHLVVILSQQDQAAVARYLFNSGNAQVGNAYIGARRPAGERFLYQWITGEMFTIDNVTGYSLDGYEYLKDKYDKDFTSKDTEDCVSIEDWGDIYTWEDEDCGDEHNAICQCPLGY